MLLNLLPWRQALYRKRLRQIIQMLAAMVLLSTIVVAVLIQVSVAAQRIAQQRLTDVQQQLLNAVGSQQLTQKSYQAQLAKMQVLLAHQARWQQNADWQKRMREWDRLVNTITINDVHWEASQLRVSGEVPDAGAVRNFEELIPAQQQIRQIELLPSGKYRFAISSRAEHDADAGHSEAEREDQHAIQPFNE